MAPLILSPRQRSELEYLASHNPVAKERCRAQALLWLEGETVEQVAESLRVSRRTVYYWLERFHDRDERDSRQRLTDAPRLPGYAQFDNDTIFQGTHAHPDVIGRVSRLCLGLGVVPVFVVPREFGFQSMVENHNGTWQAKVWTRFQHGSLWDLRGHSQRYVTALRRHRADRIESAPRRRTFPEPWHLDLQARPRGRIVYLRRTSAAGTVEVLGRVIEVDPHWLNRLVRVEVDLDGGTIRIYRLRRREPKDQPLLKELHHHIKQRRFSE